MAGCEKGREQAKPRAAGHGTRAATQLAWLRRLVQDINEVIMAAAADDDADISLLAQACDMAELQQAPLTRATPGAPQERDMCICKYISKYISKETPKTCAAAFFQLPS